jgi:Ser/Thr protein kinase RdoA (MazF antagonist)
MFISLKHRFKKIWNFLYEEWGRTTGKLHALTKKYSIKNDAWKLINWNDEDFLNVDKYIPPSDRVVIQKSNEIMTRLKNIPKSNDNYGLIHGDL